MPIVRPYPVSEVSLTPMPNVAPNVPAAGDINLFGGNRARDLQLAGQQLGQASDSLFAIYQREAKDTNDTRVQDFTNRFLDGRRAILQTGPDAYYKQQGADAITGADAATGKLTALRDELLGQTANGYQREKLAPILDAHLAASARGIMRHTVAQQDVYSRGVAAGAIETSRAEAIVNPAMMDNAVMRAEGAARALHAGQPPDAVEAGVRTAGGSVIAGVIGDRLARNDPMGVALFRQYGDRLDPNARRTLGAAAETLSNTIAATTWLRDRSATLAAAKTKAQSPQDAAPAPTGDAALDAVNAASASTAEPPPVASSSGMLLDQDGIVGTHERLAEIDERRRALTALNQQEFAANPARLRANQAAIDTDTARNRVAVKAETDSLYADLRRHLTTGGPGGGPAVTPPPATIMSRLTDAQQDSVTAQINGNIEGRRTATDPQTWYAIHQGLAADDAIERQRWASTNLVPFMGRLSAEDYASLEKLQTVVRSNDGGADQNRLQIVTRMANQALRSVGINPTPRSDAAPDSNAAQAARFHRALQDALSAVESKGRRPTEIEAYGIINGLKDTGIKSGWLKVSDSDASPTVMSDFPEVDDALRKPGAQIAQAGSEDDKPPRPDSEPSRPEQELRINAGRMPQLNEEETAARSAVRGNMTPVEVDRWISDWLSSYGPGDAAPPQMPAGLAERLTPGQRAEIEDIVSGGADTKTDREVLEEIRRGLRSGDNVERLKWANEPLYRYRPWLSPGDYQQLTNEQAQIDPRTGATKGAAGNPIGTLDAHAELAIELSAARAARWVYRAGRWILEKVTGSDTAPAGKEVATVEGPSATGVSGGAANAAATALSTSEKADVAQQRKVDAELPVPEIMQRVREQPGEIRRQKLKPSHEEIAGGEAFAALGYNVIHKNEQDIKDVQTADLHVEGIGDVEIYSPQKTTSTRNVLRNIADKQWQARSFLVQTEFPVEIMRSMAARLWGRPDVININTLFFQSPDGTIRRFDRPGKPSK